MNSKQLETKVKETLKKTKISKSEKVLVALSGGKDSATTLYLMKKFGYSVEGFYIDLSMGQYSQKCLEKINELCENLSIKLNIFDIKKNFGSSMCYLRSNIQSSSKGKGLKNCAICGVLKKWIMNKEARRLGFKYIATGHNLDDESQTFLINIFKGNPKLSSKTGIITQGKFDKKLVTRIKPLYYIPEKDVRAYSKKIKLPVSYDKCPCAIDSYRIQIRKFLETVSSKKKQNIIKNFEYFSKKMKTKISNKISYCKKCGEPSRNEICKTCELLSFR